METTPQVSATISLVAHPEAEHSLFADFDFQKMDVGLEAMLKAGVHFGHLKSRRHPKMDEYIFTTRKGINILDLEKTQSRLEAAVKFLGEVTQSKKPILLVGVKKQTHSTVRSLGERLGLPYVIDRWLGGTLTNFKCISGRAQYLTTSQEKFSSGEFRKYTKFEQTKKSEELKKLEKKVGGIKGLTTLPGALVIADVKEAGSVLREAQKMRIPVVGIVDTNTDPSLVDYPIPGNDDALSSLRFLFGVLGRGILEARTRVQQEAGTETTHNTKS